MSPSYKVIKELCKRELFSEVTELVEFIFDNDDDGSILKFTNEEHEKKLAELEKKELDLVYNEPNPDQDYDAWVDWQNQCDEVEQQQEALAQQAANAFDFVEEWWFCSDWIGNKLKEKGEVVIFYHGFAVWGRTWSNFDPYMDEVMRKIASDMEILPGQKHDWSKYLEE